MTAHRAETLLEAQVKDRPDALVVTDNGGTSWTWSGLSAASDAVADLLRGSGVSAGDRVMVLAENCAAVMAVLFGGWRLGVTVVPVNARQTAVEVDRIIAHCEPTAILMTSAALGEAQAHADRLGASQQIGTFGRLDLLARGGKTNDGDPDIAVLLYTTGTTGAPKGVMLTHGNLIFGGTCSAAFRALMPDDLVYGVLPLTHVFGLSSIIVASVCAGAAIRLEARFSVERLHRALHEGITLLSAVPQMHAALMHHVRAQGGGQLDSPTLRYVSSGAAPLDPAWKREAEEFYGLPLQNGYGMTETTAAVCVTVHTTRSDDISCGPPVAQVSVRIDDGVPGGGDGAGEVLVRGPNVMRGYFRNPQDTAKVLDKDGWLRTGDLGRIDAEGNLYILGRSKELIIHGGFNVYPPEVEAALTDHPQVIQSAVIGRRKEGDEEVLAFVQVRTDAAVTPGELRDFLAGRLAGYKRPAQILLVDSLPAAPTGKILKHRLLDVFADRLA